MHWYQHIFGKEQSHAKYSTGSAPANSKQSTGQEPHTKSIGGVDYTDDSMRKFKYISPSQARAQANAMAYAKRALSAMAYYSAYQVNPIAAHAISAARMAMITRKLINNKRHKTYEGYLKKDGPVESLDELTKQTEETKDHGPEDSVGHCNPRVLSDAPGTTMNCTRCTIAMEMRRRGYEVNARHSDIGMSDLEFTSYFKIKDAFSLVGSPKENESRRSYNTRVFNTVCSTIERRYGPGARGAVHIGWQNGGGHSIFWEVDQNGRVEYYDAQRNKKGSQLDSYWSLCDASQYRVFRLDNATPNDNIGKAICSYDNRWKGKTK